REEEHYRVGPLGKTAEVVDALRWVVRGLQPPFRGHRGEGEKARPGADETGDEDGGGKRVRRRIGQREAEGHQSVEREIERDVEEGTPIGTPDLARDSAVEPVGQPVGEDEEERRPESPGRQRHECTETEYETRERGLVRRHA